MARFALHCRCVGNFPRRWKETHADSGLSFDIIVRIGCARQTHTLDRRREYGLAIDRDQTQSKVCRGHLPLDVHAFHIENGRVDYIELTININQETGQIESNRRNGVATSRTATSPFRIHCPRDMEFMAAS